LKTPSRIIATFAFLLSTSAVIAQDEIDSATGPTVTEETNSPDPAISEDIKAFAIELRDTAMKESVAYDVVRSLTMEVGPRSAGSAGDKAAVLWGLEKLESLGFKNVHADEVEVPHWDRGVLDVRLTAPYPQALVATSLGGSIGTPEEGIEAEVVRVESLAELRELGNEQLEGRIAYVDHIMEAHKSGRGYGPATRIRSCGHVVAAERGALATIIRSAGTSTHRVAHTGSMRSNNIPGTIPAVALANSDADILTYAVRSGEPVTVRLHSSARELPRNMSANVVGEVPGTGEYADEIVILAAHLDSWDLGTGAIDDGAGVAIITAAAKLILDSGERPLRTIRVVLFANEEFGLSGATKYAESHADSIEKHVIGLEADFGAGAVWKFSSRVADGALDIIDELHELLEPIGIEPGDNKSSGGADISPLRKAGMPVFGMTQDGTYYFDYHHTADDTLDKIDRDDLNQNVAAYVTATYVAANIDRNFGRLPPDESERSCDAEFD
jgi:carboxypeptidase Q